MNICPPPPLDHHCPKELIILFPSPHPTPTPPFSTTPPRRISRQSIKISSLPLSPLASPLSPPPPLSPALAKAGSPVTSQAMSISNVGTVVLHVVVFLATLVNFHSALTHVEPVLLIGLYIVSRVFGRTPDDFWQNDQRCEFRGDP